VREYLTNARLSYEYFDIDRDPDAQAIVLSLAEGRRTFPLVIVEGRIVVDPMGGGLRRVLDEHDIRQHRCVRRPTDGDFITFA
jgi:hypothetical protein